MRKRLIFKPAYALDPFALHHAFCTLLIALSALTFLHFFPSSEAPWFLVSCLLFSQAGLSAEAHWRTPWRTGFYLLYGILAASSVFLLSLCASQIIPTAVLLFLSSLILGYLGWRNRSSFFAVFVLLILILLAAFSPANLNLAFERFYLILLGSLLVFVLRFPFFFYQKSHVYTDTRILFFQKLKKLYQLIFYNASPAQPLLSRELDESHFQIAWSDCLSTLRALKAETNEAESSHLDRLWDLTLSLGSLRYRLTDASVFTMSQDEMRGLLKTLLTLLDEPPTPSLFDDFQAAIQNFEELYRSMLQTVAKEPLVLLLFIQDLYALKEELEQGALILPSRRAPR